MADGGNILYKLCELALYELLCMYMYMSIKGHYVYKSILLCVFILSTAHRNASNRAD